MAHVDGCSGVMICDNIVMTAAHCVDKLPIKVKVGHHDITSDQIVTIQVDTILIHPGYDEVYLTGNDIALLRLSKRLPFNSTVLPIDLPRAGNHDDFIDEEVILAGWGVGLRGVTLDMTYAEIYQKYSAYLEYVSIHSCQFSAEFPPHAVQQRS